MVMTPDTNMMMTTNTTSAVMDAVVAAASRGLSVVRVAHDGTKRPAGPWKRAQVHPLLPAQAEAAFVGDQGLGVVCGAVSGGLTMLELEGVAVAEGLAEQLIARCEAEGLAELLDRVMTGYTERSPSGGLHLLYRRTDGAADGNTKLAGRPPTEAELADDPAVRRVVLIETRGEGGFVVVAPSGGPVHPTGRPWELVAGGFDTIAAITPGEERALFDVCRSFDVPDQPPTPDPSIWDTIPGPRRDHQSSPMEAYDAGHTCDEVLLAAGFTGARPDSRGTHYTRPGKDPRDGASATVWADDGTCSLWSTSIPVPDEFIGNRKLRPSQLAAALGHGGDFKAFAATLTPTPGGATTGTGADPDAAPAPASGVTLGLRPVGEIAAEIDAMPAPGWLARPVITEDAHGVLAAGWKKGKTFAVLDLAISVATGGSWFGLYPCDRPGSVAVFAGEGGERKLTRRGRAIAFHKGATWDDLPIFLAGRVPRISDQAAVNALSVFLAEHPDVRLVIIDPLYLAAGGANSTSIYEMGAVLEPVQVACQRAGTALLIAHHHNRDQTRKGSQRMSGAGPAEWGRFLIGLDELTARTEDGGASNVILSLHFEGDEISLNDQKIRRRVWAENVDDLASPLHYEVEPVDDDEPGASGPTAGLPPSRARVLDVLIEAGVWLTIAEIGDRLADTGHPLKKRTIQDATKELLHADLVEKFGDDGKGSAWSWRATANTTATNEEAGNDDHY